jgi:hypothetical protein
MATEAEKRLFIGKSLGKSFAVCYRDDGEATAANDSR